MTVDGGEHPLRTASRRPAPSRIAMQASEEAASISARHTAVEAPHTAAWAQNNSVRQSAKRLWVFMMPPESFPSLPICPASSTVSNPDPAQASRASPMKLEH